MLRFFRQIRKKLMEQNKIRTYLLYAVGEILLVVIGILIALQINNWNEQRKEKQQEEIYLESLHQEMIQDTVRINRYIDQFTTSLNRVRSFQERISSSVSNFDTLKSIAINEFRYGLPIVLSGCAPTDPCGL
tara:strand:+ start:2432 stop:2827 length:396 start_codon:yes stop_codon:yes gene_type:complete